MPFEQTDRFLQIVPPDTLGKDDLILSSFSGREEMSRLFSFQLELISHKADIAPDKVVGRHVSFSVDQVFNNTPIRRVFSGYIQRFSAGMYDATDKGEGVQHYHASVVPWLWFLTRTSDCRIFQNESVPQIIEKVFKENGFSGGKHYDLSGLDMAKHPAWEYCVQYRETDFNFVSRLMEQEGIFYYFKHVMNKETQTVDHVMCLCSKAQYIAANPDKLDFKGSTGGTKAQDGISSWVHEFDFRPGKWAQDDFDYKAVRKAHVTPLHTEAEIKTAYENEKKFEIFDSPAEYDVENPAYNASLTKIRQEEDETPQDVVQATANVSGLAPGSFFTVGEHPNAFERGKKYVVTAIQHTAHETTLEGTSRRDYTNTFSGIPFDRTFRPARITPKPSIQGTQTAIVVGPPGKEIHTDPDSFMRIKVHFHWDRYSIDRNENSSCWIRCAQIWAGNRWGAMFIPRIGQEVVVTFEEGDPDRPIVIGSVYNDVQKPAYLGNGRDGKHPHDPNLSGIKTNSTLGGEGFNELRFNDTKDKEQIFIHAQKDKDLRVLNEYRQRVISHKHVIIGAEKDGQKNGDLRVKIFKDRHLHVLGCTETHIDGNSRLLIGHGEGDGGNLDVVLEKNRKELIEGSAHLVVKGDQKEKVDGGVHLTVGGDHHEKTSGKVCLEGMQEVHIKSAMKIVIESGLLLTLKGPGGFVAITPAGVDIQGTLVKINSGGSAASGSGASPQAPEQAQKAEPTDPDEADDSKTGFKSPY